VTANVALAKTSRLLEMALGRKSLMASDVIDEKKITLRENDHPARIQHAMGTRFSKIGDVYRFATITLGTVHPNGEDLN
jgi:hypothetical protein